MRNFIIDSDTKITLYLKECYGCDRNKKYTPLHQFILDHQIELTNFIVKRIELNPVWQQEASSFEFELPLLVFENKDGDKSAIVYSDFLAWLNNQRSAKLRRNAKGAMSVRATDGTSPVIKEKFNDGEKDD